MTHNVELVDEFGTTARCNDCDFEITGLSPEDARAVGLQHEGNPDA